MILHWALLKNVFAGLNVSFNFSVSCMMIREHGQCFNVKGFKVWTDKIRTSITHYSLGKTVFPYNLSKILYQFLGSLAMQFMNNWKFAVVIYNTEKGLLFDKEHIKTKCVLCKWQYIMWFQRFLCWFFCIIWHGAHCFNISLNVFVDLNPVYWASSC